MVFDRHNPADVLLRRIDMARDRWYLECQTEVDMLAKNQCSPEEVTWKDDSLSVRESPESNPMRPDVVY